MRSKHVQSTTLHWESKNYNKTWDFELELAIHPLTNGKIIVNYPGSEGSLDGYNNKYKTLADYIVQKQLAGVVRLSNPHTFGFGWDMNLRRAMEYILKNSQDVCGSKIPEIYLMGFSAGASIIATLAWEYPEVKKILLFEPTLSINRPDISHGLGQFKGELVVITGQGENALGEDVGYEFIKLATQVSKKEIVVIPNCNHQFMGEANGRILSQAPFYAFSDQGSPDFPDPKGGIKLYV